MVEQLAFNQCVEGSIPSTLTNPIFPSIITAFSVKKSFQMGIFVYNWVLLESLGAPCRSNITRSAHVLMGPRLLHWGP